MLGKITNRDAKNVWKLIQPPGARQLMMLLAPHLLQDPANNKDSEVDKFPVQTIDPAVFKMRNRSRKSPEKSKSNEKV